MEEGIVVDSMDSLDVTEEVCINYEIRLMC